MHARVCFALALGLGLLPATARADKMSKEEKAWMESVAPLMLQDEEKRYKELKDKADRAEFQKIFWARRDPDLDTPANEYEPDYKALVADADKRFTSRGRKGFQTDCGRSLILLGEPTTVKKEGEPPVPGERIPETWTYKGSQFQGGQAVIAFDGGCMGQANLRTQFDRIGEAKILHPNIDYRTGKDGHIIKLADQLPKPTPIQALLKQPRQDFSLGAEPSFLKVEGGGTAVMGLMRGDGALLGATDQGGKKMARVTVGAQVLTEGKLTAFDEREEAVEVGADGNFLASYRLIVKPGKYTLRSGVLEPRTSKGSAIETVLDVPDFNSGELSATILLLRSFEELAPGVVDNNHALSGFALPIGRMHPVFGNSLTKADEFQIFFQYYDAKLDEATQKANVVMSVSMLKGPRPVATAPDQTFDRAIAGSSFGPIVLTNYQPGTYTVRLRLNDTVAKKELVKELNFEVK